MSLFSTLKKLLLATLLFAGVLSIAALFKLGPYMKLMDSPCFTVGVVYNENYRGKGRTVLDYYYFSRGNRRYQSTKDVYSLNHYRDRKFLVIYCCLDPEISFLVEEREFADSILVGISLNDYEISDFEIPFIEF